MMRLAVLLFVMLVVPVRGHANGFILNDHGAKATGRANAVTATVENGSAIVYNPAGIAASEGFNIYVGASVILPRSSFTAEQTGQTTDSDTSVGVTPQLFAHGKITDWLALGFGAHAPFGSKLSWPESSPGRDESRLTNLRALFLTPVVGLDLSRFVPGLTLGGGIDLVPASVELGRDVLFGDQIGTVRLGGNGFGVGGRIGAMYQPRALPMLSLGVTYRSRVKLNFDGAADFDAPGVLRDQLPPDGDSSASATLPDSVLLGVAVRPLPRLEVELNLQWMGWSAFDQIDVTLPNGPAPPLVRGYENTMTYRAGVEYELASQFDVRAGYAFDPTPIPREHLTVSLPDIDRHVVSGGLSYNFGDGNAYNLDLGLLYVLPGSRRTAEELHTPELKGEFDVQALVTALSFGARFGGTPREQERLAVPEVARR